MTDLIEALQLIIEKYHIADDDVQMLQDAIDALEADDSLTSGDDFADPYGDPDDAMVIIATDEGSDNG